MVRGKEPEVEIDRKRRKKSWRGEGRGGKRQEGKKGREEQTEGQRIKE